MHKLKNWTASRSGAGMTVTGHSAASGTFDKVAGVKKIERTAEGTFALLPGGDRVELI